MMIKSKNNLQITEEFKGLEIIKMKEEESVN